MISFGTSGWRGIIAEDFTFATVRAAARAIADHLLAAQGQGRPPHGLSLVAGYDTRFQSEAFAEACVQTLCAAGIRCHLAGRPTPTPVLAHAVRALGAAGAVNITASHNPPEWNGLKFSGASGGPALPAATEDIARRANALLAGPAGAIPVLATAEARARGLLVDLDPAPAYLDSLRGLLDLAAIRDARLRVAVDLMHGTAAGYLDLLLQEAGCQVEVLHEGRNPAFGGHPPEPAAGHLGALAARVAAGRRHLGLACDGDADRFGVLDADGTFVPPNAILALLADHLLRTRGWPGGLARSVATTHLLDRVAAHHGRPLHETPVGFKYIGELIARDALVLGGEESAGLSVRGHVPEKDGILACLLVAELVAARGGRALRDLLAELHGRVGALFQRRIDVPLAPDGRATLLARLASPPGRLAGRAVAGVNRTDGLKLLLEDGSWLLLRPSGTEPMARLYLEAPSEVALAELEAAGRSLLA